MMSSHDDIFPSLYDENTPLINSQRVPNPNSSTSLLPAFNFILCILKLVLNGVYHIKFDSCSHVEKYLALIASYDFLTLVL